MQVASSKILRLLESESTPEVRSAAAVVLGELGGRDAEVSRALCTHLGDPDPGLRLQLIRAVGKLRVEAALPQLLERIKAGGAEAEESAKAAARLGAKGVRGLQELLHKVVPGVRKYIAAALAAAGGSADSAAAVLIDPDAGVVEAAARTLMAQLPTMTAGQRAALLVQLLEIAGDKKHPLSPASSLAVVRLLGMMESEKAAGPLWDRILSPHPVEVRVAALQGLGHWSSASKEQLKRLFACASDKDFRIAAPAMVLLNRLPATDKALPEWLALLEAPDVAVRKMALEKVGDRDTKEVAEKLMQQLRHPDRNLRDAALARLVKLEHGREALTDALLAADNPDRAWQLARAEVGFVKNYPPAWRDRVFSEASTYLEYGDRRADALLFLLREADPADLRARLEETAVSRRKKKAYEKALLYLRILARDPALGFSTRLELASCGLKVSAHDLSPDARAADPCLQQFSHLAQQEEDQLFAELEKIKWLEPEELYYLGFHLAEQDSRQRKLAVKVLQLVVQRSPRSKTGQAAKSKIHSAALD
jgi:HEAT repeat protein